MLQERKPLKINQRLMKIQKMLYSNNMKMKSKNWRPCWKLWTKVRLQGKLNKTWQSPSREFRQITTSWWTSALATRKKRRLKSSLRNCKIEEPESRFWLMTKTQSRHQNRNLHPKSQPVIRRMINRRTIYTVWLMSKTLPTKRMHHKVLNKWRSRETLMTRRNWKNSKGKMKR